MSLEREFESEVDRAEDVFLQLGVKFLAARDLRPTEFQMPAHIHRHTPAQIVHEIIFLNALAVAKGVPVQREVADDVTSVHAGKRVAREERGVGVHPAAGGRGRINDLHPKIRRQIETQPRRRPGGGEDGHVAQLETGARNHVKESRRRVVQRIAPQVRVFQHQPRLLVNLIVPAFGMSSGKRQR